MKPEIKDLERGTIVGLSGSWGSGIAMLMIKDDKGKVNMIACDNATTIRSLDACYGDVITEGHGINLKNVIGKEIFYSMTDYGVVEGFTPVEDMENENI